MSTDRYETVRDALMLLAILPFLKISGRGMVDVDRFAFTDG